MYGSERSIWLGAKDKVWFIIWFLWCTINTDILLEITDSHHFAGITFTPKEVGEHLVSVKKQGQHITNSPFKIIVGSQDVGDASKVKVRGRGIAEADAGQTADFIVDTRNAGTFVAIFSKLSLSWYL